MASTYSIGRLASQAGCAVQTVRHYEGMGLMPAPERTPGRRRVYRNSHLQRLAFIRHARELGFPLATIRELLSFTDVPEQPCEEVDRIARNHLESIRLRIAALQDLETELERMVNQCVGSQVSDCRVVEVLSDHSHTLCVTDRHPGSKVGL